MDFYSNDFIDFISNYFVSMSNAERLSIILIILSAFILIFLERLFPYNKPQKFLREGIFDDFVMYTIAQNYILSIIIFSYIIFYIDSLSGLSRLKLLENIPIWVQLIFFTILHDFYIYWMHRFQHRNKWLWRIHEAHHSPKKVDWLSGSRSHAVEILINQSIEFAPIILLGADPDVIAYKGAISAIWGMYIHSNINVNSGKLQLIINGPEMHRWHHSLGKGRNNNFSTKFAFWDWIFGTSYLPENLKVDSFGLKSYFPNNYFKQFIYVFRPFKKRK
jgi:sterol desaturase/sphingolipid hydroxylase (fatty acid hydroxylase superfamily)